MNADKTAPLGAVWSAFILFIIRATERAVDKILDWRERVNIKASQNSNCCSHGTYGYPWHTFVMVSHYTLMHFS